MVRAILADVNVQGHLQALLLVLEGATWGKSGLILGLPEDAPDNAVWSACQQQEVILITANRNADGPDSLEAAIRGGNTAQSLPVFTIADPEHLLRSRECAERVVERLLEYLVDIDNYRGTGRLYLP